MKILLIYPYFLEERIHQEDVAAVPMGLYFIGALLKKNGYDVEILNWFDMGQKPEFIRDTLIAKNPDIVGLSIVHANRWGGIEIARTAKKLDPQVKIVFGGVGASFLWKHLLTHFAEIDFCIIGEGENPFLELVRRLEKKSVESPGSIPGTAFRENGRITCSSCPPPVKDLDQLPDPSRYFTYQHVSLSRGCPGNCTFCGSPRLWNRRVRFHSADYFVNQLERLYRKGVQFFYFSDDTFALKKKLTIEVCQEILNRKLPISWAAICRVNDVNEEILYHMRLAGCTQISFGIESGSEKIRKLFQKNLNVESIKNAFGLCISHGILPRAYFIYGSPGEDWKTIEDTLDLMEQIKPLGAIFYILDLFPGTELYDDYKKRAGVSEDIWLKRVEDILYFETDPSLTREQVMAFGKKLRSEFRKRLPGYTEAIRLVNKKELYPFHADFLSRLAMTFSHGDYSQMREIEAPDQTAEKLFQKALLYHPDHRAFLGLGIIRQKTGRYKESSKILEKGLEFYPNSEHLNICRGISLMNLKRYEKALACFKKFPSNPQARNFAVSCEKALRHN